MRYTIAILALLLAAPAALAQPAVLVVRHAERADAGMAAGPNAGSPIYPPLAAPAPSGLARC